MDIQLSIIFALLLLSSLCLDTYMHRKDKEITLLSAGCWSVFWIGIALAFAGYLMVFESTHLAELFLTGYVLEKALSVDNLFVMMAIFTWFDIPGKYRHRILYWGVLGAIFFRGIFVYLGTSLLAFGPWVEIFFAVVVIYTAFLMLRTPDDEQIEDYSEHIAYRCVKKLFPVIPTIGSNKFFVKAVTAGGRNKWHATPLLLCLAVIEFSDVVFAFDSVPAVIAVSQDPLIIYSAMMFAILGLRSLYFVLAALKDYLVHLEAAVVAILFYIGIKLCVNAFDKLFDTGIHITPTVSLLVVFIVLSAGILASLSKPKIAE